MTPRAFFAQHAPLAQLLFQGTGLCASVTLAQAAIESGWGESGLSKKYFNYGGIKDAWDWDGPVVRLNTREVLAGKDVVIKDGFRVYQSLPDYYRGRLAFLRANPRYRGLFAADNYLSEARLFQAAGYATDPHYAATLIRVVSRHELTKYDVVPGVTNPELARALFPLPAKAVQLHLNSIRGEQLKPDGIIGPNTVAAINSTHAAGLLTLPLHF